LDGLNDIATVNYLADTVSVLLADGTGGFQSPVAYPAQGSPRRMAAADVNADGYPDIVTANHEGSTVSVLLGNGDGTFQPEEVLAAGSGCHSVAIGDVNGDGINDIVSGGYWEGTVSVHLSNADGTFQTQQKFTVGSLPTSVGLGDFDNNGALDIVAGCSSGLSILLGNGDGTFQAQTTLSIGKAQDVAVADVNGDLALDLVVTTGGISVLLGSGDGSFGTPTSFSAGDPFTVEIADFNLDGSLDIASVNVDRTVTLLLGDGSGGFHKHSAVAIDPNVAVGSAVGDLNGDGTPDLAASCYGDTVVVLAGKAGPAGLLSNDTDPNGDTLVVHDADPETPEIDPMSGPMHGTLELHADGSFVYSPVADFHGTDTFTYQAFDGEEVSGLATVTITVNPVNDAPVAQDDSYGTDEDTPLVVEVPGVLGNDTDVDGDTLIAAPVDWDPADNGPWDISTERGGTVVLSADGSFTYTPPPDFSNPEGDSFRYRAYEAGLSITLDSTFEIGAGIGGIGLSPDGTRLYAAIWEDFNGSRVMEFSVPDGTLLQTIQFGDYHTHGDVVVSADGTRIFTPNYYQGTLSQIELDNGNARTDLSTVRTWPGMVSMSPDGTKLVVAVGTDGQPYDQNNDGVAIYNIADRAFELAAWVPLPDEPTGTTAEIAFSADSRFAYVVSRMRKSAGARLFEISLDAPFEVTRSMEFPGITQLTGVAVAGSKVFVTSQYADPVIQVIDRASWTIEGEIQVPDRLRYLQMHPDGKHLIGIPFEVNKLHVVDIDSRDLATTLEGLPDFPRDVEFTSDGSKMYVGYWSGTVGVYDVARGADLASDPATVYITVNPVNDPPVAEDDTGGADEDGPAVVIDVLANDSDMDTGDLLSVDSVTQGVNGGLVVNQGTHVSYDPNGAFEWLGEGQTATDTFTYTVTDGHGGTDSATVSVMITGQNDAPVAQDDSYVTDEDTPLVVELPGVLGNDTDVDGGALVVLDADPSTPEVVDPGAGPLHGTLELHADGSFTYTPDADFYGTDYFTYRATDGELASDPATVYITVNPVNDSPVAQDDSYVIDEDTPLAVPALGVLANDTDVDGDPLTAVLIEGPSHAKSFELYSDGSFSYVPQDDYYGTDEFTYKASDGQAESALATVSITVNNRVDLAGRVFDDLDNDGVYEPEEGDKGLSGVWVEVWNDTGTVCYGGAATEDDGTYRVDANLSEGVYKIVEVFEESSRNLLDGKETAGTLGGVVDNTRDSNEITGIVVGEPGTTDDGVGYNFAEIAPSRIQGLVWEDFNNDGEVNFGEKAVGDVDIKLLGTDDRGNAVDLIMATDGQGIFEFTQVRPGSYTIIEHQPAGFEDGKDVLGEVIPPIVVPVPPPSSPGNDQLALELPVPGCDAFNFNFAERPAADGEVRPGQTATIGFWQNKHGQRLIKSLNGGESSTQLGNWLAATFSNMYGENAGENNLAGMTNAEVAAFYRSLFKRNRKTAAGGGPPKVDVQVMAVALAVYVTNQNLAGTTAASYGFEVTQHGVGIATFDVGDENREVFGLSETDSTIMTVLDILQATDARTSNGLLYDLDADGETNSYETLLRTMANDVYTAINEQGDL